MSWSSNAIGDVNEALSEKPNAADTGLIAVREYDPGSIVTVTTTSTTLVDVDATNLAITFAAPASGKVLIDLQAYSTIDTNGNFTVWGLREGTTTIRQRRATDRALIVLIGVEFYISGLTPGQSYTYKFAHRVEDGARTSTTRYGGTEYGKALMQVWAV